MHRLLGVALAVLTLALGGLAARVQAQEATPVGLPVTPGQEQCTVEPRSAEEAFELIGTTSGTPAAGEVEEEEDDSPTLITLPVGEPADEATTAAVTATVVEVIACTNAGDYLRAFALYGPDLLASFGPIPEEALAFIEATPQALSEEDQATLVDVRDVLVLGEEGDRAAAVVVVDDPMEGGETTTLAFFALQDDRFILEDTVENVEIRERSPATPIP